MKIANMSGPRVEANLLNQNPTSRYLDLSGFWWGSSEPNEQPGGPNVPAPRIIKLKTMRLERRHLLILKLFRQLKYIAKDENLAAKLSTRKCLSSAYQSLICIPVTRGSC